MAAPLVQDDDAVPSKVLICGRRQGGRFHFGRKIESFET